MFSKKELEDILEFLNGDGFSISFAGTFEFLKSKDGYDVLGGGRGKWIWLESRTEMKFPYQKKDGTKDVVSGAEILKYEKISDLHMKFFGLMCAAPELPALAEKLGNTADSRVFIKEALKHY